MNILNVINKASDPFKYNTIDENFGSVPVSTKPDDPEKGWRQELDELERRFQGLPSTEAAEQRLSALEGEIKSAVAEFEGRIAAGKKALKTPFLSKLDETHIRGEIAALEQRVSDFHKGVRVKLAHAKALVEQCKEWNPQRGRFLFLRKRAAEIAKATGSKL
jgi:hypothetical protein